MAAYGALVSLMHIIDRLKNHPSPPISINKQQVESLTENITLLQDFLDGYISPVADGHKADPLERRIADAVYAAEDVIESHIVVQIDRQSTIRGKMMSTVIKLFPGVCKCANIEDNFYHDLQQVIEEMNLIEKEAMETAAEAQLQRKASSIHAGSFTSSSTVKESMMVGFDEVLLEVLDKLTGGQLNRQIIPIMGMGGIGKTTLARNIFDNALIKEHFDICAWTTISQTYDVRETLREVLFQACGVLSDQSEHQLGEQLYKYLSGRRYLIIMDDMWSIEVWDKLKFFFPDYNDGSRIIVTTRLSNMASQLSESYGVGMKFLDESSSWNLFCKTVFGPESCPHELEAIGKNIVANCKGLPLSIATIGGLLAKSERTREYWERIEQNLSSIVIMNNDDFCLKILKMSYIYLPNYLKPCFLYMGVFEEDRRIRVSTLKKLWVSEGFLKPKSGKCLETIAQEYFKELVDRNLILVHGLGCIGNAKYCKIHDLVRDMCLKEVEKERFCGVITETPPSINSERRVVFPNGTRRGVISEVLGSLSRARSVTCDEYSEAIKMPHNLRMLRTLKAYDRDIHRSGYSNRYGVCFLENALQFVNSRHVAVTVHWKSEFPSSIDLLWGLNTLIVYHSCEFVYREMTTWTITPRWEGLIAPIGIWRLHQLRHLECMHEGLCLPDPPRGDNDIVIMENLQTLRGVENLYLNEEVVKRIPNVKKLCLKYVEEQRVGCLSHLRGKRKFKEMEGYLSHLQCLSKLEHFQIKCYSGSDKVLQGIRFPNSLKKLSLHPSYDMELEDILQKIGLLPLLQKLVLEGGFFKTCKWETIEGHFPSLKFLVLRRCLDLENWRVLESSHLPRLELLCLDDLRKLQEIPSEVGEIPTLKLIVLGDCSESAVVSAKRIVEEQEDFHGDELDLHVRARVRQAQKALQSLATPKFEVQLMRF